MPRKTFIDGDVLPASDLNNFLMNQSVMTFATTAARTTAIPTPVEGMLTYLEDVDRYEHWNGSAWVSPFGLTLLNTTSFTGVTTAAVNNVFTSAYQNYQIVYDGVSTTPAAFQFQLRLGGTASTTTYVWSGTETTTSAGPTRQSGTGASAWKLGTLTEKFNGVITVSAPAVASRTNFISNNGAYSASLNENWTSYFAGGHNTATAYDGFSIISTSANMTGTVRTYGYRN